MRRAPGQFILTTHSPYLVSMSEHRDLTGIVRFDMTDGVTRQHRLTMNGEPDSARLRKALGESADTRALLFARGVVLVEGGTELGALPEWFGKSATAESVGSPDGLNVVIFSVDGDPSFGTYAAFLHAFGVPWAIVCDGLVYRFGTGKRQIFEQVLSAGVDDSDLRKAVDQAAAGESAGYAELRDLGGGSGIFTLAESWEPSAESFEAYLGTVAPAQLADAAKAVGKSKPRQGRHVTSATECPGTIDGTVAVGTRLWYDGQAWEVAEVSGAGVVLRDALGGIRQAGVGHLLCHPGTRLMSGDAGQQADAAGLGVAGPACGGDEDLRSRVGHVLELLTGYKHGSEALALPGEPRTRPGLPG